MYYACVNNGSGTIRMVNEGESCPNNQILIQWNQIGPKGDKGDTGDQGPDGLQGPKGVKGDQGEPGPSGVLSLYKRMRSGTVQSSLRLEIGVYCDEGDLATGGGFSLTAGTPPEIRDNINIYGSKPRFDGEGWFAEAHNPLLYSFDFQVEAVCADITE